MTGRIIMTQILTSALKKVPSLRSSPCSCQPFKRQLVSIRKIVTTTMKARASSSPNTKGRNTPRKSRMMKEQIRSIISTITKKLSTSSNTNNSIMMIKRWNTSERKSRIRSAEHMNVKV